MLLLLNLTDSADKHELRFYVPFNIKIRHFKDVLPNQSLNTSLKKLNLADTASTN